MRRGELAGAGARDDFGRTLVVGAGPAGIHAAVCWSGHSQQLGLMNRRGPHAIMVRRELERGGYEIRCEVRVAGREHRSGTARIDRLIVDDEPVADEWETVLLCTPADRYAEVLEVLQPERLSRLRLILLLSPGIGSAAWIGSLLGEARARVEVISLSTYFAASKFISDSSPLLSVVKAFKRCIRIGSTCPGSAAARAVSALLAAEGVDGIAAPTPLAAESWSITAYVHPPLFLSEQALAHIFSREGPVQYMYKLYPEGPISPYTIRSMVRLWKEISQVLRRLKVEPLNLLKFLQDDNYPVHEASLPREWVERFVELEEVHQEYALYVRYASLLIDPFSAPDASGRYYEFSAVPFQRAVMEDGNWNIPRIPREDAQRLMLLQRLGGRLGVAMPEAGRLLAQYWRALEQASVPASEAEAAYVTQQILQQVDAIVCSQNVHNNSPNESLYPEMKPSTM